MWLIRKAGLILVAGGFTWALFATPVAQVGSAIPANMAGPSATPTLDLTKDYGGWPPYMLAYNPTVQAIATAAVQNFTARQTAEALTPTETMPPAVPTDIPAPTPTLGIGLITDTRCAPRVHKGEPTFDSCWHTQVNGNWVRVGAGYYGFSPADIRPGERVDWQGLVWVCTEPCDVPMPDQIYPAPRPDLHITAVNGAEVTLASRDPAIHSTALFNVLTHQWVPPLPSPTLTP